VNTLQIDTGDLIPGLRGLAKADGEISPREETGAAVELCNNLIFYRTVFYDGNVVQSNLSEIKSLIAQISRRIADHDTRELFLNKLQPLILDHQTEPLVVRESAREAIGFLPVVDQLVAGPAANRNPFYQDNPFTDLPNLLNLFKLPDPRKDERVQDLFNNRSIRGGRFFWGLLQEECFEDLKKYLEAEPGHEPARLQVLFSRFRYRFAANRGRQVSAVNPEIAGKIYYQPERNRQILVGQFEKCLDEVSTWKKSIEPELMRKLYPDGAAYLDSSSGSLYLTNRTNIPLLINRALRPLSEAGRLSRANLLRQCLELSQDKAIEQIWNALETFDSLSEEEKTASRDQIREFAKTLADPLVSGKRALEAIKKVSPLEVLKEFFVKTVSDNLSASRHASSILGRSIDGLSTKLEVLASVQTVFGSIPN
jgi:hypothetical protein